MRPYHYLAWAAAISVVLCLLAIALGVVVDPYRVFGTSPIPSWTALKPRLSQRLLEAKTYQLERVEANTLLLGNSRIEVGFDPDSPHWPVADRPVYNAAIAGRGLQVSLDMLRDADAVHPPPTVILGLDFVDFLEASDHLPASPLPERAEERRLLVDRIGKPNPARRLQWMRDALAATLTIDAVVDSLLTLAQQDPRTTETRTPLGFDPLSEYHEFVIHQGSYTLFAQKNSIYYQEYRKASAPDFLAPLRFASFRYLVDIINLCTEKHQDLIILLHPYHTNFLDILHEVKLWQSFEYWKRALVQVAAPGIAAGNIRVFDFSGYNRITREPVPSAADRHSEMQWYWESGHYKSALGDLMIDAMRRGGSGFGVVLTPAMIDRYIVETVDQ